MKKYTFLLVLAGCSGFVQAQTALLGDFDFSQGGYTILYVPAEERYRGKDSPDVIAYFEDIRHLNTIQQELVYESEARQYAFACFGSASVLVCKNRKLEVGLSISENCHSITSPKGEFAFLGYFPFEGYKIARQQAYQFSSLAQARKALDSLLQLPDIIYIPDPEWRTYDGKFAFFREDVKIDYDKVEADVRAQLTKAFPGDQFELTVHTSGGSSDMGWDFWCEVRCKKTLFDRFDLYKVNALGWQAFPLELESYWK